MKKILRKPVVENTGIPAGLLGEISTHNEPGYRDYEEYSLLEHEASTLQGIAMAQQRTGLSIYLHAGLGRPRRLLTH